MKLFYLILGLFCLTSCHKKDSASISAPKEIRLNLRHEPATLDPRKGGDLISSHMHFLLFEGLVRRHADNSLSLAQAQSYEQSETGLVYTFKLRKSFWSNGLPVTAYDFEKSWKTILDPAFPSADAHLLYPIKNAEDVKKGALPLSSVGILAVDDKTLIVTLDKPTPYFLELISFSVFFPVCSKTDAEYPSWAQQAGPQFVSNGPFILKKWKHNDEIVAVKNPFYWDREKMRPERIHFSMVDNEMTALQLFEKGELDMIGEPLCPLPVEAIPSLKQKWLIQRMPIGATSLLTFNVNRAPFNHAKIRKALSFAINRDAVVKNIVQIGGFPALNAVPPILKQGRNYSFFKDADYVLAQTLLKEGMDELGITKEAFSHVTFFYSNSDKNHKIAQALQQQWKEILGLHIHIENLESKVLADKLSKRDYALAQVFWAAQYNDPMNILERFKSKSNVKNYPSWENAEYSTLLDRSFYAVGNERAQILEKAEALFLNEMPVCPLYHWEMTYLMQPKLADAQLSPVGDLVFNVLSTKDK